MLVAFGSFDRMDATAERIEKKHEGFERLAGTDASILVIRRADNHAVFQGIHTTDETKIRNRLLLSEYLRDHADPHGDHEELIREAIVNHAGVPGDYTEARSSAKYR